jgi:hypothetical protein
LIQINESLFRFINTGRDIAVIMNVAPRPRERRGVKMPVAKCTACGRPSRKHRPYGLMVAPAGYPDSALVCGVSGCEEPAMVWLTTWEAAEYRKGRRVFNLSGRAPKVRLSDTTCAPPAENADPGPIATDSRRAPAAGMPAAA